MPLHHTTRALLRALAAGPISKPEAHMARLDWHDAGCPDMLLKRDDPGGTPVAETLAHHTTLIDALARSVDRTHWVAAGAAGEVDALARTVEATARRVDTLEATSDECDSVQWALLDDAPTKPGIVPHFRTDCGFVFHPSPCGNEWVDKHGDMAFSTDVPGGVPVDVDGVPLSGEFVGDAAAPPPKKVRRGGHAEALNALALEGGWFGVVGDKEIAAEVGCHASTVAKYRRGKGLMSGRQGRAKGWAHRSDAVPADTDAC